MASLVDAIRKILEKYDTLGQYRILFGTCSCKVVDRKERKKLMIKHKEENNTIKQWSQQRKNILGEKTIQEYENKQENIQKKWPKNTKWILVNQYLQDALALTECIEYYSLFVKQF